MLTDIWIPEVEGEYLALLGKSRRIGIDVGNQFRAFEHVLDRGVDKAWRPVERAGSADVYVMHAIDALMFFVVSGSKAAVVKWCEVGTEYQQRQYLAEALQRAARIFP